MIIDRDRRGKAINRELLHDLGEDEVSAFEEDGVVGRAHFVDRSPADSYILIPEGDELDSAPSGKRPQAKGADASARRLREHTTGHSYGPLVSHGMKAG